MRIGTGFPAASNFGCGTLLASRTIVSVVCPLTVGLGRGKLIRIGFARGRIKLERQAARRMIHAITDRHHREHHQRGDLNDVDGYVYRRGAGNPAMGDVGDAKGKEHGHQHHEHGPGFEALMKFGHSVPTR